MLNLHLILKLHLTRSSEGLTVVISEETIMSKATQTPAPLSLSSLTPKAPELAGATAMLTKKQMIQLAHLSKLVAAGDAALAPLSASKNVREGGVMIRRAQEQHAAILSVIKSDGKNLSQVFRYLDSILTGGTIPAPKSAKTADLFEWVAGVTGEWISGTSAKPRTEKTQEMRREQLTQTCGPLVQFLQDLRTIDSLRAAALLTAGAPAGAPAGA